MSIALGTLAGLFSKYILDRNYIFDGQGARLSKDVSRFFVYSISGIVTTVLFLGVEWLFITKVAHPLSQYIGAAVGLSIGYALKYNLDRRITFNENLRIR